MWGVLFKGLCWYCSKVHCAVWCEGEKKKNRGKVYEKKMTKGCP